MGMPSTVSPARHASVSLALEAGLRPTYISLLERGLRNPSLVTVRVLAQALETTMTSLVRELESSS